MKKIVSANLNENAVKIYNQLNKIRQKGWFSKDVSEMLILKYGDKKKQLLQELSEGQAERDKWEIKIRETAKKLNKFKK